ncbi:hypothetical protein MRS44_018148 [Fusarium solani]|uniref:uncharacterized protein n=1 Tax=Fusarium solani TaxID=169388 RepID=UPI0032C44E2F|nr:hypothetical protein MRS44_018148 [Fusarium solani]
MTLNQIENFRSQSQDQIPIDPALEDPQQAPTGSICVGAVGLPLTNTPLRDNGIHLTSQAPPKVEIGLAQFRCGICNSPFREAYRLREHARIQHPDKDVAFGCNSPGCHGSPCFDSPCSLLSNHDCPNPVPKPYSCSLYKKTFAKLDKAQYHVRRLHADAVEPPDRQPVKVPFVCNYVGCKTSVSIPSQLQQHIWKHSDDTREKCKCGKTVGSDRQAFKSHAADCGVLDRARTPTFRIECDNIYGCRRDGCVEDFGQFHDLLRHLKAAHCKTQRPHCGLNYRDSRHVDSCEKGPSKTQMGSNMPLGEDQPHHQAQQVVGDIVQRQNLGEDNTSSTKFFCYHPECHGKIKRFDRWGNLQRHVWTHSKRRRRECTCDDGGPRLYEKFKSHLEQGTCRRRDPDRIPPDLKGMMVYGCIKYGAAFAFDSRDALRKHLKSSATPCPRCGFLFFRIKRHLRMGTCLRSLVDTKCDYCRKHWKTLDDYRTHLASCPNNPDNQSPDSGPILGGEDDHEDDDRASSGGGDEYANYDCDGGGGYGDDNTPPSGDEDGQSALHQGAEHGRPWDQDHMEPGNQMQPETESRVHPPPAATSFRGLLTPRSTFEMGENIAQCRAMPASDRGAPDSSITTQPEQPARLDAYPPEDGEESGTDSSRSLVGDRQDIPSETESGAPPHYRPQQVVENTTRGWFSVILNSPATITSDHSIQPLADDSGHTYEPSQARSPLQASPTASPYSTNELPRHRDLRTARDDTVRLASELDYSKEASATVQHSGHPVTALSAVAQSTEGEAGPRAAKPDSSGQSTQPTESRRKFRPRNAIKLLTASPFRVI